MSSMHHKQWTQVDSKTSQTMVRLKKKDIYSETFLNWTYMY